MNHYFIFKCRYCGQVRFEPCTPEKYRIVERLIGKDVEANQISLASHRCNETDIGIMEIVGYKKTDFEYKTP